MTRLILAHDGDVPARLLAARWGAAALLVTPEQLVERAWSLHMGRDGTTRAAVHAGDDPVPVTTVVNRLGGIGSAELPRIRAQDRTYAAAELTAFLRAWLRACNRRVLNPPGAGGGLNGPGWTPEAWLLAAAAADLPVRAARRQVRLGASAPEPTVSTVSTVSTVDDLVDVAIVAGRCVGPADPTTAARLRTLALAAGTPLMAVTLDRRGPGAAVVAASAWPDVGDPAVAAALDAVLDSDAEEFADAARLTAAAS